MGWLSGLAWVAGGAAALVGVVGVLLYVYQEKLLYFPAMPIQDPDDNPRGFRNPEEQGMPYEDVFMTTRDGVRIHGWLIKRPNAHEVPTLVYFHGNAGNIGLRLSHAREVWAKIQVNIFLVDYRGYGKSQGRPSEAGLILDAEAALRALREDPKCKVDLSKVLVFGRSLGGAVALAAADEYSDRVAGVVVENTFLSMSHMVDVVLPILSRIKPLVLRMRWDNEERVRRIKQPVLFVSGMRDELIPPWQMRALYSACPESVGRSLLPVASGTHNDTWLRGGEQYLEVLAAFIAQAVLGKKGGIDLNMAMNTNMPVGGGSFNNSKARQPRVNKGQGQQAGAGTNGKKAAVDTETCNPIPMMPALVPGLGSRGPPVEDAVAASGTADTDGLGHPKHD